MGELKYDYKNGGTKEIILEYRPHVKWLYKYHNVFLYSALAFATSVLFLKGYNYNSLMLSSSIVFFGFSLWVQGRFIIKPLAEFRGTLKKDCLHFTRMGEQILLNFNEIERVSFSHLSSIGGWFSLHLTNGKKYKFTVVMENAHHLLDAVKEYRGELVNQKDFESYRFTQVYSDHSWERIYEKAKRWPSLLLKYIGFPTASIFSSVVFCLFLGLSSKVSIVLGVISLFISSGLLLLGYLIGEYRFNRKLKAMIKDNSGNIFRNKELEERETRMIYKLSCFLSLGITVSLITFVFMLNK